MREAQKPALRPYLPSDAPTCAAIAEASITDLAAEDYTESQQEAWIAALADEERLNPRLSSQLTLLATLDSAAVGFASLRGKDHVDLLFVHPAAARLGVGSALCDALEKLAAARGAQKLTAEVSDNAQSFFRGRGYVAQQRNTIPLGDEWLGNTTMTKALGEGAGRVPS